MTIDETIAPFRAEIDAIDKQLIELLKARIGIVAKVGEAKKEAGEKGVFIRSGREGAMVNTIYEAFKGHDFSADAAANMWRQIIAASIHLESPLSIAALQDDACGHLFWLAREYFGSFVPITPVGNLHRVFGELSEGRAAIGVLPYPDNSAEVGWWELIAHENGPKIFAHLPATITPHYPRRLPTALAVADIIPSPSGDDQSYLALALQQTLSSSGLQEQFRKSGLKAECLQIIASDPRRHVLMRVEGFLTPGDETLKNLLKLLDEHLLEWHIIGAHARVPGLAQ